MKTRYLYMLFIVLKVTDLIIVNLSFVLAFRIFNEDIEDYLNYLFLSNYLWILAALIGGVYKSHEDGNGIKVYSGSVKTYILFTIFFLSVAAFSNEIRTSLRFIFVFYNFILIGLFLSRYMGRVVEIILKKYFDFKKSVAVFGRNNLGVKLETFFEDRSSDFSLQGLAFPEEKEQSITDFIESAAKSGVKEVYVPMPMGKLDDTNSLIKRAEKHCVRLKFVPDFEKHFSSYYKINYMGGVPVLSLRHEPLEDIENRFIKRVFDIIISLIALIFVLSWLYPLIGLIIKIQSPGPILFKQQRNGKDNRLFMCYKFRSMKMNDGVFKQATKNDDRVTAIGRFIRKTSIDELPQFFNVLIGNMSVVGPRPHPLSLTEQYSSQIKEYMVRHFLKSGITGWAQVNGFRGETNTPELMQKRIEHDVWYLENWSPLLDFKIVYLTVYNVFKGEKNAY